MANATVVRSQMAFLHGGQRGFKLLRISITWPGAAATCTVPCPGLTNVDGVQVSAQGTPAGDEEQSWSDALVSGVLAMNTQNPVITLTRTGAAKTNNLPATVWVSGW